MSRRESMIEFIVCLFKNVAFLFRDNFFNARLEVTLLSWRLVLPLIFCIEDSLCNITSCSTVCHGLGYELPHRASLTLSLLFTSAFDEIVYK